MQNNEILLIAKEADDKVREFRHELHKRAEIGLKEYQTTSYIRKVLSENKIAFKEVNTGTIVDFGEQLNGSILALRAEIDALPIQEDDTCPYHSLNKGFMHACGHDCNTAMLLATVLKTFENKDKLKRPVRFIFQPAEEGLGGAISMIESGCLENVSEIYCLHMQPGRSVGQFATKENCIHASSYGFIITINGKTAHGSTPNEGVDAIWITGQVIMALQGLISREISAFDNAVLSIGKIHGGSARNVVCDQVVLDGTLRTTDNKVREYIIQRIKEVCTSIATLNKGSASFELVQSYVPCFNSPEATKKAMQTVISLYGEESLKIHERPNMGGEDFGFYEEIVPGCKLHLGSGAQGKLHSKDFSINEDTLVYGVGFFLSLIFG